MWTGLFSGGRRWSEPDCVVSWLAPSQASQLPPLKVFAVQNVGAGLPAMRPVKLHKN
jgi:hypothetical protein